MEKFEDNLTFEDIVNQTLKQIKVGTTVNGTIVEINSKGEIFANIGYKADGIIPRSGFIVSFNDLIELIIMNIDTIIPVYASMFILNNPMMIVATNTARVDIASFLASIAVAFIVDEFIDFAKLEYTTICNTLPSTATINTK